MKKILKNSLTLLLVLALAFSFAPISAEAASNAKFKNSRNGKVCSVLYKGCKAKKASFSMNSPYTGTGAYYVNGIPGMYDVYNVNLTLTRPSLSKNDVARIGDESLGRGANAYYTYSLIITDSKGNTVNDVAVEGGIDYAASSSPKDLTARSNRLRYRYTLYDYRKTTVFNYTVYIPQGHDTVYMGFAGLRGGQPNKKTASKLTSGKRFPNKEMSLKENTDIKLQALIWNYSRKN